MIMMISKFYFKQKILGGKLGAFTLLGLGYIGWGEGNGGPPKMGGSSGTMD